MGEIYVEVRAPGGAPSGTDGAGLVDTSPVATLVYDLRHRVIRYANRALADLAGRRPEQFVGVLVDELLQPTEALLPTGDEVATSGAMLTGEALLRRPDGRTRHVDARTLPVEYAGEPCGQVALWDITERVKWEQELLHRASHDTLTGLPNAWFASIHLHKALRRSGPDSSQHLAVFFIDLDGFKQINDTFGHHAGDAVLRKTASRLREMTVRTELTARLHGDEFLVVCEVANAIHAAHLAQRIRRALARPIQVGTQTVSVTASVGIAVATPSTTDADRLLRFADHRMYTDKRNSPASRRREHPSARGAATGADSAANESTETELPTARPRTGRHTAPESPAEPPTAAAPAEAPPAVPV